MGPVSSKGARPFRRALAGCVALTLALAPLASPGAAWAAEGEGENAAPSEPPSPEGAKLEQAGKMLEELNYTEAQQLSFEVVKSGNATPDQLAQAYFNIGVIESALDNEIEATDSFYLALMLKPDLLFPEGGSPKIRQRLNEARSRVTEVGVLEARARLEGGVLNVQLVNDPLQLVRRVEVMMTREGGEVGKATLERDAMRVEVESGVQSIRVVMYDEAGNQLKVVDVDPAKASEENAKVAATTGSPSVWGNWGLWAGVAGALALGGTYFVMESGSLQGEIDDERGAAAPNNARIGQLEDKRDQVGLYGVVGLSLAGAAAVTAGALLLFGGDDGEAKQEAAPEAAFIPSVAPGHVGARFEMTF